MDLRRSTALWNRATLRLDSDETLVQILDRGEMDSWRALYEQARGDAALRKRILRLLENAPIGWPHFWRAALASLGEEVDYSQPTVPLDTDWT